MGRSTADLEAAMEACYPLWNGLNAASEKLHDSTPPRNTIPEATASVTNATTDKLSVHI